MPRAPRQTVRFAGRAEPITRIAERRKIAAISADAKKFTGRYEHRTLTGGIGHNLPQEAPQAFARAIIDVDGFGA